MKKLIAMIGAVAAAFGLYADGVLNQKVTFESPTYTVGDTISNSTEDDAGKYSWYLPEGASEESGTVAAETDDNQYLAIETDAGKPLARTFVPKTDDNAAPTPVDIDKGLFLDTKVKFTLGEEQPTVGDGTKLVIWAKETEADTDVAAATNLMVLAGGAMTAVAGVTPANYVLDVGADFDFSAWHRVTVRAIKNVTKLTDTLITGFVIFIDEEQVGVIGAAADYEAQILNGFDKANLSSEATKFFGQKQLFVSLVKAGSTGANELSYTGFEGAGSIDDLALCNKDGAKTLCKFAIGEQTFAISIAGEITGFDWVANDGESSGTMADLQGSLTVLGSATTITFSNFTLTDDTKYSVKDAVNGQLVLDNLDAYADGIDLEVDKLAFLVDGQAYTSFEAAFAAALTAGKPIVCNADFDMVNSQTIGGASAMSVEIDLAGNTLTWKNQDAKAGAMFFVTSDGSLKIIDSVGDGKIVDASKSGSPLVECDEGKGILIVGDANDKGATFDGVIVDNMTPYAEAATTYTRYVNAKIVCDGNQDDETTPPTFYGVDCVDANSILETVGDYFVITPKAVKAFAIILAGQTDPADYYDTLAEAIDNVTEGCTIQLTEDIPNAVGVKIENKPAFTIDFNGKTYTVGKPGVGTTAVTQTQGFNIVNGAVTFKDGTICCPADNKNFYWEKDAAVKGISMLIQNHGVLTLENMVIDGSNLAAAYYGSGAGRVAGPSYVVSNDGVGADFLGSTSITAREQANGQTSYAFDVDKTAAVVLNTTGTITGDIAVTAGASGSFTYTAGTINGNVEASGAAPLTGFVAKVNNICYGTVQAALAAVQALEAAGTYPIVVVALDALAVPGADEQVVNLAKDDTITITDGNWAFSGAFNGAVVLAEGKTITTQGKATGITAPAGLIIEETDNGDGTFTYSVAQSKGFIIRVAGIDAADVTEGDTSFTIATTEKPLVYIAGVAAEVGGEEGAWTVAKPEITADTCVSVVKDQAIAAVGTKWYVNPTLVGKVANYYGVDLAPGFSSGFDAAENYLIHANGFVGRKGHLTTLADMLNAGEAGATPIYFTGVENDIRGAGISTAWGVTLAGATALGSHTRAYSLTANEVVATFTLKDMSGAEIVPAAFSFEGANTLWVNDYVGATKKLYKFTIPASGFVDGMELTAVDEVDLGTAGKYHFRTANIGGTTYFYVFNDGTLYAGAKGAIEEKTGFSGSRYSDLCVAGEHIYFFDYTTGKITVYALDTATGWVTGDAIATFDAPTKTKGASIFVTQDEENLIFCGEDGTFVYQYTTPVYKVTFNVDGAEYAVSNVLENTVCGKPADPVKEGFKFVNWTNETYTTGFDFTTPITADLTLEANFEAAGPVWPDLPAEFPADADDAVKAKYADWAKTYDVKDASGLSDAFLMNVDPDGTVPELEIDSITVEGDTATIVVSAGETNLGAINGVLFVSGTDDLAGEWTTTEVAMPTGDVGTTATFVVEKAKFMKAKVGFKAETPVNK